MRKLMVICPTKLLNHYSTDAHMVLTQYYWTDETYRNFYKERVRRGDFVLLDNGACELGRSISAGDVVATARDLHPNVVVASDVIYDAEATIARTTDFVKLKRELPAETSIMAVPQGDNLVEWFGCYEALNALQGVDWIGISKFYCKKITGGRATLLRGISARVSKPCHLLGLDGDPASLAEETKYPFVKSIDTAKPVAFGIKSLHIDDWKLYHGWKDDDYHNYQGAVPFRVDELIRSNIRDLQRRINER